MSNLPVTPAKAVRKSKIKPWRREPAARQNPDNPLISEDYIDPATQRLVAISFIVFIQAYKMWDRLFSQNWGPSGDYSNIVFLIKYVVIEGAFLAILPIFRIPWLTFTYHVTLLLFVLSVFANLFIATVSISSFSAIFLASGRPYSTEKSRYPVPVFARRTYMTLFAFVRKIYCSYFT